MASGTKRPRPEEDKEEEKWPRIDWIWGPTCVGKTLYIKQRYPDAEWIADDLSIMEGGGGGVFVVDDFENGGDWSTDPNDWHEFEADRIILLSNVPPDKSFGEDWKGLRDFRSHCFFYEAQRGQNPEDPHELWLTPVHWSGEWVPWKVDAIVRKLNIRDPTDAELEDI